MVVPSGQQDAPQRFWAILSSGGGCGMSETGLNKREFGGFSDGVCGASCGSGSSTSSNDGGSSELSSISETSSGDEIFNPRTTSARSSRLQLFFSSSDKSRSCSDGSSEATAR